MAISKRIIVQRIVEQLTEQLATLAQASRAMHADASDEQNKAEDQYDTRGLETAYLASSQARLATETEQARTVYQNLELRRFGTGARSMLPRWWNWRPTGRTRSTSSARKPAAWKSITADRKSWSLRPNLPSDSNSSEGKPAIASNCKPAARLSLEGPGC